MAQHLQVAWRPRRKELRYTTQRQEAPKSDKAVGPSSPLIKRRNYEPARALEDLQLQTGSGATISATQRGWLLQGEPDDQPAYGPLRPT